MTYQDTEIRCECKVTKHVVAKDDSDDRYHGEKKDSSLKYSKKTESLKLDISSRRNIAAHCCDCCKMFIYEGKVTEKKIRVSTNVSEDQCVSLAQFSEYGCTVD